MRNVNVDARRLRRIVLALLVVVTAAGGGIQAAAWTAQVLAGLDRIYGPDFTRSVGLVSGVSGGSVGTMYYMAGGDWTATGLPATIEGAVKSGYTAAQAILDAG